MWVNSARLAELRATPRAGEPRGRARRLRVAERRCAIRPVDRKPIGDRNNAIEPATPAPVPSLPSGTGRTSCSVPRDMHIRPRREVVSCTPLQGQEVPPERNPSTLPDIVAMAQRLRILNRCLASAAVWVDVVCLKSGSRIAAPKEESAVLAPPTLPRSAHSAPQGRRLFAGCLWGIRGGVCCRFVWRLPLGMLETVECDRVVPRRTSRRRG